MIIKIFGVPVEFNTYEYFIKKIFSPEIRTVTCANHNYLNNAFRNKKYREDLKSFDLIHPDGIGVELAGEFLARNADLTRINGSDLYPQLLNYLAQNGLSVFIIGDKENILNIAVQKIQYNFPGLIIKGFHNGFFDFDDKYYIDLINSSNADILLVGLGGMNQEYWVNKWKNSLKSKKIIVICGWLRIVSGDRIRGPFWVQKAGFEWLVRLITEPHKNWKRYLVGIPLFIYRVIKQKIKPL